MKRLIYYPFVLTSCSPISASLSRNLTFLPYVGISISWLYPVSSQQLHNKHLPNNNNKPPSQPIPKKRNPPKKIQVFGPPPPTLLQPVQTPALSSPSPLPTPKPSPTNGPEPSAQALQPHLVKPLWKTLRPPSPFTHPHHPPYRHPIPGRGREQQNTHTIEGSYRVGFSAMQISTNGTGILWNEIVGSFQYAPCLARSGSFSLVFGVGRG